MRVPDLVHQRTVETVYTTMPAASDPHFVPWIGPCYEEGIAGGIRLLVLGESHYANPHPGEERMTRKIIEDQLSGRSRQGFLTRLQRLVHAATDPGVIELEDSFWMYVAFYNYVQELVGPKSRMRPSRDAWRGSAPAFAQQLEELRPHAVLVCGRELWDHLKVTDGLTDDPKIDRANPDVRTRTLLVGGRAVGVAAPINHPSSRGFRRERWVPAVEALLRRSRSLRDGLADA